MYRDLLAEYLRQQAFWDRTEVPNFLSAGIPIIRGHILTTKGTLHGCKIAVADHPDAEGEEDDLANKGRHQRKLLKIHRTNLSVYLKRQEQFGEEQTPPIVIHSINHAHQEIQRIKAILRGWNVAVEDLAGEE